MATQPDPGNGPVDRTPLTDQLTVTNQDLQPNAFTNGRLPQMNAVRLTSMAASVAAETGFADCDERK
jgi:hypothetical protein